MKEIRSHIDGQLETVKFADRRDKYYKNLPEILELAGEKEDLLHYFPAYVGELTLIRNFSLIEAYHKTKHLCGHFAEIGVYKASSSILFGKLLHIYEPDSLFMVHGFDNWEGTSAVSENPLQVQGGNVANEDAVRELIRLQNLESAVKIHNLDAEKDFPEFFEKNPHLQFRLVFCDSGTYEITSEAIKAFWPRLLPGGIMIFDQFNSEVSPGETRAVRELLPNEIVRSFIPGWMPSGYIIKGRSCQE